MSRTTQGARGPSIDWYPTPAWAVERILDAVGHLLPGGAWLEPAVGEGAICDAVDGWRRRYGYEPVSWTTVDVRDTGRADLVADFCALGCPELDALEPSSRRLRQPWDVCITNPPFSLALQFLEEALLRAQVLLLRLGWLASRARAKVLQAHTPCLYVLPDRPSFDGEGTDSADYGWLVWGLGAPRLQVLGTTSVGDRRAAG